MNIPMQNTRNLAPIIRNLVEISSLRVADRALRSVGLGLDILEAPPAYIPYALTAKFTENVARQIGESHVGVRSYNRSEYSELGPYAEYVLGANSLADALARGFRAMPYIHTVTSASLRDSGEHVILEYDTALQAVVGARHLDEGVVFLLIDLVRNFAGPTWRPAWICLPQRSMSAADLFASELGIGVVADSQLPGIAIEKALLLRQKPQSTSVSDAMILKDLASHFIDRPPKTMGDIVQNTLTTIHKTGNISMDHVGSFLGIGMRTLQRRLQCEGTTFQEVLDRFRLERAQGLLVEYDWSIAEVARIVGYSDVANFRRAFRRWTGCSPQTFRNGRFPQ